ncbi:type II secretion system GspH family protein [Radiobacillus kanasensis]|uniref:type IV pilus modification PilV family protein n=1 Tax=Radiobacillus kanasensis TaxID=2844358 RepID=UPI001E44390C|nr:type II secretion system protein [Radiobacillus kanasensis]UFT99117.1 type II secretion system GspH family protein [Radiobacillus kanasensis]
MKGQKGFTLVELLATIAILSVVIVSFMWIITHAFQFNNINSDELQATNIVREKQALFKENESKHTALQQFITNVTPTAEQEDFLASRPEYAALNLTESIQLTFRMESDQSGNTGEVPYYLLKMQDGSYIIHVYVRKDPDTQTNPMLYRLYIQTFKDSNLLSDTYTYLKYS